MCIRDSNATQRDWIAQLLGAWGVNVALADSGHRALGLLNSTARPFDAVVMDARMPDLSGFAVLQSLPASEALLRRTLMLLPANEWHSGVARCSELGVNTYLVKPVSPSDLLDALQKVLAAASDGEPGHSSAVCQTPFPVHAHALDILLVEDNPVNQKLATRVLERMGHRISLAIDGAEAGLARVDGIRMPVLVRIGEGMGDDPADVSRFAELEIAVAGGTARLADLCDIRSESGPGVIARIDGRRVVTVELRVREPGPALRHDVERALAEALRLPPGHTVALD